MSKKRTRQQKISAAAHRLPVEHVRADVRVGLATDVMLKPQAKTVAKSPDKLPINEIDREKVQYLKLDLIKTLVVTVVSVIILITLTQLT